MGEYSILLESVQIRWIILAAMLNIGFHITIAILSSFCFCPSQFSRCYLVHNSAVSTPGALFLQQSIFSLSLGSLSDTFIRDSFSIREGLMIITMMVLLMMITIMPMNLNKSRKWRCSKLFWLKKFPITPPSDGQKPSYSLQNIISTEPTLLQTDKGLSNSFLASA